MTPWGWWWLAEGDDPHGGWDGEHDSRELAIGDAVRHLPVGARFHVMEARSSDAMKYEGAECVPFLRTRNKELLTVGPALAASHGAQVAR